MTTRGDDAEVILVMVALPRHVWQQMQQNTEQWWEVRVMEGGEMIQLRDPAHPEWVVETGVQQAGTDMAMDCADAQRGDVFPVPFIGTA